MQHISRDGRRITGTDQGTGKIVYQVGQTTYSNQKKYNEGWERIWGDKKDEAESICIECEH